MTRAEIFENRREVGKKLCEQIRQNDGQIINAKNFLERPYYAGEKKYKFSTANYLRLMSAENIYPDPRWYKIDDVEKNNWKLKNDAKFELLEEWQNQKCLLTKFYNASEILEVEKFSPKNKSLEEILKFLQVRGVLENENIISFRDAINSVKKYAGNFVVDELTKILTVQMWTAESKLKTKIKKFLPIFSYELLTEIEKNPDKIFDSVNKALAILKNLRREKILPTEKVSGEELFLGLKIIFHGSEGEIKNTDGFNYQPESILTGVAAYKFLSMLKSSE